MHVAKNIKMWIGNKQLFIKTRYLNGYKLKTAT